MGIDKPNVRYVVHYDLPKNIESYYQETGRAGRDGLPSQALLLYGRGDIRIVRGLIEQGENPERNRIELRKLNTIVKFAEATTCRRQELLAYFGERMELPCGNCDVCTEAPTLYDATEEAKLLLMAIYGIRQRFGMRYVTELVRGDQTDRIIQMGHDKLEQFGAGSGKPAEHWMGLLRHLIQRGILSQDEEQYSVLKLTPLSKPILREGERLMLPAPRAKVEKRSKKSKAKFDIPYDEELFQRLRTLRRQIADEEKVPPYVVFGDQTLIQMAAMKPGNEDQLLLVSGVGEAKLKRYGRRFLAVIAE